MLNNRIESQLNANSEEHPGKWGYRKSAAGRSGGIHFDGKAVYLPLGHSPDFNGRGRTILRRGFSMGACSCAFTDSTFNSDVLFSAETVQHEVDDFSAGNSPDV
jgi:hypothetical protein